MIAAAFLLLLVIIDLAWTPRRVRLVEARIAAGDPDARTGLYRLTVGYGWTTCAIAILILAGVYSIDALGLRAPSFVGLHGIYAGIVVGAVGGTILSVALTVRPPKKPLAASVQRTYDLLVPTTRRERGWFAAVALTAGITEEVVYRALPFAVMAVWFPDLDPRVVAVVAAAIFGLAHAYQGVSGVAATALMGAVLGLLYAGTGSLIPSMALHAIIDLRLLLLPKR